MALICDTSGVFALYDTSNVDHEATAAVVEGEPGELLVPVLLLVEIDYLLHSRLGADAAHDFFRAVEGGEFNLGGTLKGGILKGTFLFLRGGILKEF